MNKRERVMAALRGEKVDQVPVAFWEHNYATENSPQALAQETLRLARELDWDFLKPQVRAQVFAEAWGAVWRPSGERTTRPTPVSYPIRVVGDLAGLSTVDPTAGPLGEQLEALRLIRHGVGPNTPIIWTVFNPLMISRFLSSDDIGLVKRAIQEQPKALSHALDAIATTMAEYSRAALDAGADGLFYATNVATDGILTPDEYRQFGRTYDRPVLEAVAKAPFNMLHICGDGIYFDLFADYDVDAFNWALGPRNPTLSQVERSTGKAVAGGISTKPRDIELSTSEIAEEARAAIREMKGRHVLVAPGCSSSPGMSDANFQAATRAAREPLKQLLKE
jgi:uroporphyrinogen decarboxylase